MLQYYLPTHNLGSAGLAHPADRSNKLQLDVYIILKQDI